MPPCLGLHLKCLYENLFLSLPTVLLFLSPSPFPFLWLMRHFSMLPLFSYSLCLTLLYLTHTAHPHDPFLWSTHFSHPSSPSGFYSAPCAAARCLVSSLSYVFSCLLRECGSIEETPIANSHSRIESQAWNCTAATGTWIANQLSTASTVMLVTALSCQVTGCRVPAEFGATALAKV